MFFVSGVFEAGGGFARCKLVGTFFSPKVCGAFFVRHEPAYEHGMSSIYIFLKRI